MLGLEKKWAVAYAGRWYGAMEFAVKWWGECCIKRLGPTLLMSKLGVIHWKFHYSKTNDPLADLLLDFADRYLLEGDDLTE